MIEKLRNSVVLVNNGEELEQFRDLLTSEGLKDTFGYVANEYKDDPVVSSGYFHYDEEVKGFYLSTNHNDKDIIHIKDLI